jgi:hypothetical protein
MCNRFVFLGVPIWICIFVGLGHSTLFYEKFEHLKGMLEPILKNIDIPVVTSVFFMIIHVNQYTHF